jgi:hypothetical protein
VRLWHALKSKKWHKDSKFAEYIGCSKEFLLKHLESQFQSGMTWENYGNKLGQWSIDHKIPLFRATSKEEMYKLCHYTNLQPLWAQENSRKSNL